MRILLVGTGVHSIPPMHGGAVEKIEATLLKEFSKSHEVYITDIEKHDHGIFIKKYNFPQPLTEVIFGFRSLIASIRIKPDITHCHTVFTALPFAIFNRKFVYTSHNPAWTVKNIDFPNRIILGIEQYIMKRSTGFTVVSRSMEYNIANKYPELSKKIHAIYNFADTRTFSPKYRKIWKRKHNIKKDIILFVGKPTFNKGISYLLQAFQNLNRKNPNTILVIAGSVGFETKKTNPWKKLVKNLNIENDIIFTGSVNEADLQQIYPSADVFCLPSFPVVILEAMASGLPIVATNVSGIPEAVNKKNSYLVPPENPEALEEALLKALKNKKSMSRESLKLSRQFNVKKIVNDYLKFYEEILNKYQKGSA